jgi:squalene-hopene/tetraprenyl-beta-curcumene cyclase
VRGGGPEVRGGGPALLGEHSAAGEMLAAAGETLAATVEALIAERVEGGFWEGRLSTSALSTATAVAALGLAGRAGRGSGHLEPLVDGGIGWLVGHQNDDGGWGDTPDSPSNISTTILCWAALGIDGGAAARAEASGGARIGSLDRVGDADQRTGPADRVGEADRRFGSAAVGTTDHRAGDPAAAVARAEAWLRREAGELTPERLGRAIEARYGSDRTFSVPILTLCALSGRFGDGPQAWRAVPTVPFELAACPRKLFEWVGLPMVSYALPALIATGQAIHHHRPTRNPVALLARNLLRDRTLRILDAVQPPSGGFIEAIPLTSFVVMSLVGSGEASHPVVDRGLGFLCRSVRDDGSWPIDSNLATWVTTLSINALAAAGELDRLDEAEVEKLRRWLLDQQYREVHPYTNAPPGGWAWTPLSGGVPDADDTPGALLALANLAGAQGDEATLRAATAGITWLLGIQNRDGGIPTFCRGWSKLPFDHSSPDLTAHALRAWGAWREALPPALVHRLDRAVPEATRYLVASQRADGAWVPLWFGNQEQAEQENPVYGTSRVLRAHRFAGGPPSLRSAWASAERRAVDWLLAAQQPDGGFGADGSAAATIEETALAIEALSEIALSLPPRSAGGSDPNATLAGSAAVAANGEGLDRERILATIARGSAWLIEATERGRRFPAAPIGLYFAKLWYAERLYPLIFTASALGLATRALAPGAGEPAPEAPAHG